LSMRSWGQRLEIAYSDAIDELDANSSLIETHSFQSTVEDMLVFYSTLDYSPFDLEGFPETLVVAGRVVQVPGQSLLSTLKSPERMQNGLKVSLESCEVERAGCGSGEFPAIYFDFRVPNTLEVISDFILIFLIIFGMVIVSFDLTRTLNLLLVKPMERMLGVLHTYASSILDTVLTANKIPNPEADKEYIETDLLEDLLRKLAHVAQLSTHFKVDMEGLDNEGKGVMLEMMHVQISRSKSIGVETNAPSIKTLHSLSSHRVASLTINEDHVNSWEFDVLGLTAAELSQALLHIFFDSSLGSKTTRRFVTPEIFTCFADAARENYLAMPYHCYLHACDVVHTSWRVLSQVQADRWLSAIDQYALLVAALSHDMGHFGRANPFLVETKHELALRYNDSSPLENMHCAKLFELASDPKRDMFALADKDDRKQARKVCIGTILHTDNVHHMEMVRDISTIYEVNSELCEMAAGSSGEAYSRYLQDVLQKDTMKWLQLFLHFADVSNPTKPFRICKAWAWRVIDEFFDQGDEERRLGLPVGMLNDREKVNKPGSQHGFINFMVAPLVFATVRLFPTLHPMSTQMAYNLEEWRELWVQDANPSQQDITKREEEVGRIRDTADDLAVRPERVLAAYSNRRSSVSRGSTRIRNSMSNLGHIQ